MIEDRLFHVAPAVMHIDATYVEGEGWSISVVSRRPGEEWADCRRTTYTHLATVELLDVVWADVAHRLGIA